MQKKFIPLLLFCMFCLGGGFLYLHAMQGAKLTASQAYYASTTPYFFVGLLFMIFGLYLIRWSIVYDKKFNQLACAGLGFFFCLAGSFFIEQLLGY